MSNNNPQYPGLQPIRPPIPGSMDPQRNFGQLMPVQFRPVVPAPQQQQQFVPMPAQHYHQQFNVGMPPQNQQPQFSQPIQQFQPRVGQQLPLPPQMIPLPVPRPNMQTSSESMMPQPDSQAPNGYTPGLGGPGMSISSSFMFASSSYGQAPQNNFNSTSQYQPVPQIQPPAGSSSQSITPGTAPQSNGEQPTVTTVMPSATIVQPHLAKGSSSDWIEHTSATGRRFYYNKRTKLSSWEKPFELMTPIERVDASTNWKEYTSPDGRKYYYNKITKESKWLIPEELKFAREQVGKAMVNGTLPEPLLTPCTQPSANSVTEAMPSADNSSLPAQGEQSSPISVAPVVTTSPSNLQSEITSGSRDSPTAIAITGTKVDEPEVPVNIITPSDSSVGSDKAFVSDINTAATPMNDVSNVSAQDTVGSADGVLGEDKEDGKIDSIGENVNDVASETKSVEPESLIYANKMEAKDAFKALLDYNTHHSHIHSSLFRSIAMAMAIRVFLSFLLFLSLTNLASSLYEDQVGLMDWHQQYIGKVKHAVFHTQKTGRKRVLVSTEENVVASLDLRHGEIFWRHVLGTNDVVDGIDIALGKYVITLSSDGSILRAWNLPDGQMVWESSLQGSKESKSILNIPKNLKADKDDLILVFGKGCLHAISGIDGEVLWRKDFASESIEVSHIIQSPDVIYVAGFVGSLKFYVYEVNAKSGELLKNNHVALPFATSGESLSVSGDKFVVLDDVRSKIVTIDINNGDINYNQKQVSDLIKDSSGQAVILPSKLPGLFALKINSQVLLIKVTNEGELVALDQIDNTAAFSNALSISEDQHVFAFVQYEDNKIQLSVKDVNDWNGALLKENLVIDHQRGNIEKIFINNYVRTDRSHGFRALMVMEDHSLLLVQQGEIVWSREDGLASVIDVTTSELPVEKEGVSVAKVEQNLFEWLKGHLLKLKGTLMIASAEEKIAIQKLRLRSSEKSKMTRDHNGFRKLLIVLTRAGKVFALHTGDGRIVWSTTLHTLRKSEDCEHPVGLNIYQWQVPHHHALDENPSLLVIGRCGPSVTAPTVISFLDAYTGKELNSLSLAHTVARVIPLPYTDSTEQRLHLIIDVNKHAYLYPRTPEAIEILKREFSNIYWYSVETDNGVIRGHALKSNCIHEVVDEYCFVFRDLWSIVFPSESEKIIATVTRKSNEVVHTQAKVMTDHDVMYKYISKNILFVANAAPKASGEIGTATPEEATLVIYIIDTVTGRILHRMTHHGCQGPVHAVFSENWVVYHYFNLRAHRHEMSVIEVYDQSRADNKDIWKFVLGKHNLTSPISSYYRPEISAKSQSYFFTHSVKAIEVTSTAKGITSKQLLIGTIGDQVLALDKRFLDPRRTLNPSQAEKEEGIIPLTDSLPIISQSYITHSLKVEGLRGIVTVPAKLESTSLVFAYGVDLFFTQIAPSRTYDSLTEDFSYALLLLTIVALVAALFVTYVLSERKDLEEKWR